MAAAASDKPAQAEEAKTPRRSLWRRIPTPIVVTLVGLVLSAWLLPAITRQWDDRQKAHDLQASLIEEMSTASARALAAGANAMETRQSGSARLTKAEQAWEIAAVEIQAKLRAYFPQKVVRSWANVRYFMAAALSAAYHREVELPIENGHHPRANVEILGLNELLLNSGRGFKAYTSREEAFGMWMLLTQGVIDGHLESEAERNVLAAHPRGYSTTWRDLFHDLVP
jgi:hypothetical protein